MTTSWITITQVDNMIGFKERQDRVKGTLSAMIRRHVMELGKKDNSQELEHAVVSSDDVVTGIEYELSTSTSLPTSLNHLSTVQLPASPFSVFQYKGSTYVGLSNGNIARVDSNYQLTESFITCPGGVESITVYKDRVYTLLCGSPYVVSVYDMAGSQITQWNVFCNRAYYCNELTIASDQVVVAEQPEQRISLYSLSGQLLKHIPCSLLGGGHEFMCGVEKDFVVISNSRLPQVFKLNITTGEVMWTSLELTYSMAVCSYGRRYILVFTGSKTLKVLDSNTGDVVGELSSDSLTALTVLGLSTSGTSLVAVDDKSKRMQFYKISC